MKFQELVSLAQYTTFKIGGPARFFCIVKSDKDVVEAVIFAREKNLPFFVLGGGSNLLVSDQGYGGLVIKNEIGGIEKKSKKVPGGLDIFSVGSGVVWDDFVKYSVETGYYGLENLSSIPGVVGAAPVQNIGAYGSDVSESVFGVKVFDVDLNDFVELDNAQCEFGYRDSHFKKNKGRYIITRVDFALNKNGEINIYYKDLKEYFANHQQFLTDKNAAGVSRLPTLSEVRDAVVDIRSSKLPDWKKWGTAGSFFKNPIISVQKFAELKKIYPELPGFMEGGAGVKISLGWILDKVCNAKGITIGNAGTYEKQALVLVSKSGATAAEVVSLSQELMRQVKEKTGMDIEAEVEWVN